MESGALKSSKPPSILATAEKLIEEQAEDGFAAGVVLKDGDVGAQVTADLDVGKPGGWTFGAVASWAKKKGAEAAAMFRWTKD